MPVGRSNTRGKIREAVATISAERDAYLSQRDVATGERNELRRQLDIASGESNELRRQLDIAIGERNDFVQQRDQALGLGNQLAERVARHIHRADMAARRGSPRPAAATCDRMLGVNETDIGRGMRETRGLPPIGG
jgi:hypothetical protein